MSIEAWCAYVALLEKANLCGLTDLLQWQGPEVQPAGLHEVVIEIVGRDPLLVIIVR